MIEKTYADFAWEQAAELLAIDSPCGYTARAARWVKDAFEKLGFDARITVKGGVLVDLGGVDDKDGLYLEAHVDTLGLMVRAVREDGQLSITCATPLGRAEDVCPIEGNGEELVIGFNNSYLLDALKAAPAEVLQVNLGNGSSPCVLTPEDGSDKFLYMILPVRLRAGE